MGMAIFILTAVLASFPGAMALEWNEFTNNLASDLAPLIALFGEQVTKQFLSESLSIWDNIIFAMAPLGIITAVVSAIRVCGSPSLRAFIGRAQEGPGNAELELLSCTSETTTELWNEGGIARVFGKSQVLEVVKLEGKGQNHPYYSLVTFSDACNEEYWRESRRSGPDDTNSAESTNAHYSPSLSLNIGIKRRPMIVLYGATVFGIIIQIGVLIYASLTVYRYPMQFLTNGRPAESYAFPFTICGTILLCLGMFLCAFLIERSTNEIHYKKKDDKSSKIYWVQPGGQKIGDQVFKSYIGVSKDSKYIKSFRAPKRRGRETIILWAAVLNTSFGFFVQFISLRAMHSSVILAQLGITLLMAVARASLRAERAGEEKAPSATGTPDNLVQGHELDHLAMYLGNIKSIEVAVETEKKETRGQQHPFGRRAIMTRARLAQLTDVKAGLSWEDLPVRKVAMLLQDVLEHAAQVLLSPNWNYESRGPDFFWPIKVKPQVVETSEASNEGYFYFYIHQERNLSWKTNCNELEAVIGIWALSLLKDRAKVDTARLIEVDSDKGRSLYLGWIQRNSDLEVPSVSEDDNEYQYFGRHIWRKDSSAKNALRVPTQNSLLAMCAQDIYISFLAAALHYTNSAIDGKTVLRKLNSLQNAFIIENDSIEALADKFEDNLGSREDAYMCIVPTLAQKLDLSAKIEIGNDPEILKRALSWAARRGQDQIIVELLQRKVDINSTDIFGKRALTGAISGRFKETVKILLDKGASTQYFFNRFVSYLST